MILNRRKHPDTCSPDTAVTADGGAMSVDDTAMTAALVTELRRRTPPVKLLKQSPENPAFTGANAAAKNIHSSIQRVPRRFRKPFRLTKRELALNAPEATASE